MYNNANIFLASKHHKEKVIAPLFKEAFNATIFVEKNYDTDIFGVFTGEIPREAPAQEVVQKKAVTALEEYPYEYSIASEGSFGPHPVLHFCPADIEFVCFFDKKKNLAIIESEITTETNFDHLDIDEKSDFTIFLEKILFPSHAVILRSLENNEVIEKGICDLEKLKKFIEKGFLSSQRLRIETDMRASFNPTRMKAIQKASTKLIERLKNNCEKCQTPGFGIRSFQGHLFCDLCGLQTNCYAEEVQSCLVCDYKKIYPRSDGRTSSDPQHCSYCNP